ncbi:hypothetical protein V498_04520 [Pseudogymnoascus sp. VKM F-4517 (FW-2822)]|nr:hypothetical protein V498_04520 [Pseudogymnoascus sp. VKM F-4517 (FW-2822)]
MPPHILLLGAHGKIALQLLPLLLSRSWSVTALIRDSAQTQAILATKPPSTTGTLDVLVDSLDAIRTTSDATRVLEKSRADWVVWSAGAGGKGGPDRTNAVDRDAAIAFARAAAASGQVKKFLLISALSVRRHPAPWWSPDAAAAVKKAADSLAVYTAAKLEADEVLTVVGEERRKKDKGFSYIILRPGALTDDAAKGKVLFGRTEGPGKVPRGDVARVAAEVLGVEGANGWYDLLEGEGKLEEEVGRVVREGKDAVEGEKIEEMKAALERAIAREKESKV